MTPAQREIFRRAYEQFGLYPDDIILSKRGPRTSMPARFFVAQAMRDELGYSYNKIGMILDCHHQTAMYLANEEYRNKRRKINNQRCREKYAAQRKHLTE